MKALCSLDFFNFTQISGQHCKVQRNWVLPPPAALHARHGRPPRPARDSCLNPPSGRPLKSQQIMSRRQRSLARLLSLDAKPVTSTLLELVEQSALARCVESHCLRTPGGRGDRPPPPAAADRRGQPHPPADGLQQLTGSLLLLTDALAKKALARSGCILVSNLNAQGGGTVVEGGGSDIVRTNKLRSSLGLLPEQLAPGGKQGACCRMAYMSCYATAFCTAYTNCARVNHLSTHVPTWNPSTFATCIHHPVTNSGCVAIACRQHAYVHLSRVDGHLRDAGRRAGVRRNLQLSARAGGELDIQVSDTPRNTGW